MVAKEEKARYSSMMVKCRADLRSLINKLEKLDEEMDTVFVYDSVLSAIYHLDDADMILRNLIDDLNHDKEVIFENELEK